MKLEEGKTYQFDPPACSVFITEDEAFVSRNFLEGVYLQREGNVAAFRGYSIINDVVEEGKFWIQVSLWKLEDDVLRYAPSVLGAIEWVCGLSGDEDAEAN